MNRFILGIALAISAPAFAQTDPGKPIAIEDKRTDSYLQNRQPPVLRIKVVNSAKKLADKQVTYTVVHLGSETQEKNNTRLDQHGEAAILLSENLPYQQVWLSVEGFYYAGLLINSDLNVEIDASLIGEEVFLSGKGVTLKGADAQLNEQLMQNVLYKRKEKSGLNSRFVDVSISAANGKMPAQDYIKTADSVFSILKK